MGRRICLSVSREFADEVDSKWMPSTMPPRRKKKKKRTLVKALGDGTVTRIRRIRPPGSNWYLPFWLPAVTTAAQLLLSPWVDLGPSTLLVWAVAIGASVGLGIVTQKYLEKRNPTILLVKHGWWRRPFGRWRPIKAVIGVKTAYRTVSISYLNDRGRTQEDMVCRVTLKEGPALSDAVANAVNKALNLHGEPPLPAVVAPTRSSKATALRPVREIESNPPPQRRWQVASDPEGVSDTDAGYREPSTPKAIRLTLAPIAGFWSQLRSWFTKPAQPIDLWLPRSKIENTKFIAEKSEDRWRVRSQENEQAPIAEDLTHEEAAELVAILKRER